MENAEEHGCEIDQRFEASISAIYSSSVYVQRYLVCVCYFSEVAHQSRRARKIAYARDTDAYAYSIRFLNLALRSTIF